MTSRLRLIDRLAVVLIGLLSTAAAMAVLSWHYRHGAAGGTLLAPRWLHTSPESLWWPWVLVAIAVALIGLAAWWVIAHLPRPTSVVARLPGTDRSGQLRLDLTTVADTAARVLGAEDVIASAKATIHREFGRAILEIRATTTADDLPAATSAASGVHAQLGAVLDSAPVPVRTLLRVKTPRKNRARVQ